ncbi:MAG: thiol-disulfide oxidoreductase DCC family protein [Ferruginibacter sp.]
MNSHPIILFDGICNLCNGAVQYVIKHDSEAVFQFASLQSEAGQNLLQQYSLPQNNFNSFVLIDADKAYTKSTAALKVAKRLKGGVKLLYGFIIVPAFIRNGVYNIIANNRYKWFGKKNECMIPTPSLQSRFLK